MMPYKSRVIAALGAAATAIGLAATVPFNSETPLSTDSFAACGMPINVQIDFYYSRGDPRLDRKVGRYGYSRDQLFERSVKAFLTDKITDYPAEINE